MTPTPTPSLLRHAAVLFVALALAACSDGDGGAGEASATSTTSTPGTTLTFDERDSAIQLTLAATGMNLVAGEVGLRAARGEGGEYCRSMAPSELAPHQAALQEAADPEVRRLAQDALAALDRVVALCAEGAGSAAVQQAVAAYNPTFDRLRRRIEALAGTGT